MKTTVECLRDMISDDFKWGYLNPTWPNVLDAIQCVEQELDVKFDIKTGEWIPKPKFDTKDYVFVLVYNDADIGDHIRIDNRNDDQCYWYTDNTEGGQREFIYDKLSEFKIYEICHGLFAPSHGFTLKQTSYLLKALGFREMKEK